jgi:hypothetical protein
MSCVARCNFSSDIYMRAIPRGLKKSLGAQYAYRHFRNKPV